MSESDTKKAISELDAATSIESTDLLIISKLDNGDYVSRKISFSELVSKVAQDIKFENLPTSDAGLAAGELYQDNGALKVKV